MKWAQACTGMPEEHSGSLEAGVTGDCESGIVGVEKELESSPREKTFLTADPPLLPLFNSS